MLVQDLCVDLAGPTSAHRPSFNLTKKSRYASLRRMIDPVTLKGFRDYLPDAAQARNLLIRKLERTFEAFGFVPIDTPALEYAEILLGKGGGETEKQVYRFFDNGNRDVALRYDLTVPFARFMAGHRSELYLPFKRYHIAKAWRGENPQRGRFREFMQCDFDIVGCDSDSADFEILVLMVESMKTLGVGGFQIQFSHRGILNRFLRRIGLADRGIEILRIIDKLAKAGSQKTGEMLSTIMDCESANRVLDFIREEESFSKTMEKLTEAAGGEDQDTARIRRIQELIEEADLSGHFRMDPSITRGLDYYTGIVYETTLTAAPQVGSVCSGGRYNDLASLYAKETIPGVGASIGLDRLLSVLEETDGGLQGRGDPRVLILFMDERYLGQYHRFASELRSLGIGAEVYPEKKKLSRQFQMAEKKGIPFALICGEEEMKRGITTLKDLETRKSYEDLTVEKAAQTIKDLWR
jgi:histidyl-tRNA synthetase